MKLNRKTSPSKYLIFTSAGDNCNIKHWLPLHHFDLFVVYYGDSESSYEADSDYFLQRKGGKFHNLYYIFLNYKYILESYEAVLILDDDLIISPKNILKLFIYRENFNLTLLQPAFDLRGKNSHDLTIEKVLYKIRYTNFVEVGCPLFKTDALLDFLSDFDDRLNCAGVDYWYSYNTLKNYGNRSIAIIDEVTIYNPHDNEKSGTREIDALNSNEERKAIWKLVKKDKNLKFENIKLIEYEKIRAVKIRRIFLHGFKVIDKINRKLKT